MKRALRRLRLREGDIVVVKDHDTLQALMTLGPVKGIPPCPIVVAPHGIGRLGKDYIRKLLAP